jgi:DNA-binding response OmpR family regulator
MEPSEQKIRILLVEDEKKLAHSLQRQLAHAGYLVELAFDGCEAEEKALHHEFELIILDINLPKKSGIEILQTLRARGYHLPVLILSARDKVEDRVRGLQLGADDYLIKPFDSGELLARLEAILRRSGFSSVSILQAGDLTLDVVHHKVKRAGHEINLTQKEYALLEFFLRHKNQILTRRRIAEQVCGYKFDTGTNIVDVYISYLRKAIDEGFPQKLIHTMHGEGFILMDESTHAANGK